MQLTSTLGVLDLGDLLGDLVPSDLDSAADGRASNGAWIVRVDDSAVDVSAPAAPDAEKLPVDDDMAAEKRDKLPVASDDVTGTMTSPEVGSAKLNGTSVDEGQRIAMCRRKNRSGNEQDRSAPEFYC